MKIAHRLSISTMAFLIGIGTAPVLAQTAVTDTSSVTPQVAGGSGLASNPNDTLNSAAVDRLVDRDLNTEQSIENGLRSGQLTTAEAARLERGEGRVDQMESSDLNSGGKLTAEEAAKLRRAQSLENSRIARLEANGATASGSAANDAMAADVQRNLNQQSRIDKGIGDGSLTMSEVANLEGGQASVDKSEAAAGRDNSVTTSEQQTVQGNENTQGGDIRSDRHNSATTTALPDSSDTDQQGTGTRHHDHDHDRMTNHDHDHFRDRDDMIGGNMTSDQSVSGQTVTEAQTSSTQTGGGTDTNATAVNNASISGQTSQTSSGGVNTSTTASATTGATAATPSTPSAPATVTSPHVTPVTTPHVAPHVSMVAHHH